MKSPAELMDALRRYETAESAIAVYKEAAGYIKQFEEVKAAALDCARAEAEITGAVHQKFEHGSAGWTQPQTQKLNRERWQAVISQDAQARQLQAEADSTRIMLEEAQQAAGCFELPEARFYIK